MTIVGVLCIACVHAVCLNGSYRHTHYTMLPFQGNLHAAGEPPVGLIVQCIRASAVRYFALVEGIL
jgi:hypothetical protein